MTTQPAPALIAIVGQAEAERIAELADEMDRLNVNLLKHTGAALIEIGKAQAAITRLVGPAVFDIEYVEGNLGADVKAELETAARALRNVERIALMRHEMNLAAQQAAADVQPGDEGTCGAALYPNDPDRDVQCTLPPHGSDVQHDADAWAFRA